MVDDPDPNNEEPPQDGAQDALDDAEGDDTERGGQCRQDAPQTEAGQAWQIVLAERNEAGDWRTVGEPVPGYIFSVLGDAIDHANRLNQRDFGRRFDWANDPKRAWIAVRSGAVGRL